MFSVGIKGIMQMKQFNKGKKTTVVVMSDSSNKSGI